MVTYAYQVALVDGYQPRTKDEDYWHPQRPIHKSVMLSCDDASRADQELLAQIGASFKTLADTWQFAEIVRLSDNLNERGMIRVTSDHSKVVLAAEREMARYEEKKRQWEEEVRLAKKRAAEIKALDEENARISLALDEKKRAAAELALLPIICDDCGWEIAPTGRTNAKEHCVTCSELYLLRPARPAAEIVSVRDSKIKVHEKHAGTKVLLVAAPYLVFVALWFLVGLL